MVYNFGSRTLVYQPGGTAKGDIFTDWASLVEACKALFNVKRVDFDDTYQSPILVPPKPGGGVWDFGADTEFYGAQQLANPVPLLFQEGAQIAGVFQFSSLTLTTESSLPVISNIILENILFKIN